MEQKITKLFNKWEKEKLSEEQIKKECYLFAKKQNFDENILFLLNDEINYRGYNFNFELLKNKISLGELNFENALHNAAKNKENTLKLIEFLKKENDHRLFFSAFYALKIKHLLSLNILKDNQKQFKDYENQSLRDYYFSFYLKDEFRIKEINKLLPKIGFNDFDIDPYLHFRMDMEYLLWTIRKKIKTNPDIKINTIKVALGISPKNLFEIKKKKFYEVKYRNNYEKYLQSIDKLEIKKIKEGIPKKILKNDKTGYAVLYKLLCKMDK